MAFYVYSHPIIHVTYQSLAVFSLMFPHEDATFASVNRGSFRIVPPSLILLNIVSETHS